ncbi:serine hydrolase domain-containing protein [Aeromicrobium sp. CF3.5]|uniref:serine hydrolase domain-containing protein n=1 Tax=Aeromicrobium sp. CF3.5 TaxID=3373078 RepID=UPI003EE6F33F
MALDPSTVSALTARLATEQARCRLPSVVAGLVRDGQLVWSGGAGSPDGRAGGSVPSSDTQYRLGSISKTFVAVEVLRLRDAGALDLGDRIDTHLPEIGIGQITVAQLLTHTSGLQAETNGAWWERSAGGTWEDLLDAGLTLRFTPGTTHHYSNVGYAVLGELVARLRQTPWTEAVRTGILEPLGMTRTTTRPAPPAAPGWAVHPFADLVHIEPEHDAGALGPAGQLWSTVEDMVAWSAFVAGETRDVLAPATLHEMLHPAAVSDVPGMPWGVAHGLGWQVWNIDGRRYAGHGGSMPGFLAQLRVDLETGDGLVLMTNATSGLGTAGADLLALLAEREPAIATPWSAETDQLDLLDLTGSWFWGTASFTATLRGDDLVLGEPGTGRGSRFRLSAESDQRVGAGSDQREWIGLDGCYRGEILTIARDADGRPVGLDVASFIFTRTPYDPAVDVPGGLDGTWH